MLVGGISYLVISSSLEDLMTSSLMDLNTALAKAGSLVGLGFLLVTLSLLVVVAIDVPYQLNAFKKRMKEIKDEMRETEGVPLFSAPPLARALFFTSETDESVPESLYNAVAQVIAYIFKLNSVNADGVVYVAPNVDVPGDLKLDSDGNREVQDSIDE